jgi:hypothetical protein
MRPDGSGEALISSGGKEEGPTWAPNGRVFDVLPVALGRAGLSNLVGGCYRPK